MSIEKSLCNCIVIANNNFVEFKKENRRETNNLLNYARSDLINEQLKILADKYNSNLELLKFKKGNWEIRLLIDHSTNSFYSILNSTTFKRNISNNSKPHYLKTLLRKHNNEFTQQLSFFDDSTEKTNIIDNEYYDITKNCSKLIIGYKLYTILYTIENSIVIDICMKLLDPQLNIVEDISLNEFIESYNFIHDINYVEVLRDKTNIDNTITDYNDLIPEKLIKLRNNDIEKKM